MTGPNCSFVSRTETMKPAKMEYHHAIATMLMLPSAHMRKGGFQQHLYRRLDILVVGEDGQEEEGVEDTEQDEHQEAQDRGRHGDGVSPSALARPAP